MLYTHWLHMFVVNLSGIVTVSNEQWVQYCLLSKMSV